MTKHSALTGLKDWIDECLSTDVTPLEIYTTIIDTVKNNARYHEVCASQSRTLIAMLKNSIDDSSDVWERVQDPNFIENERNNDCLLYTSPSPRDRGCSRMPSSA